MLASCPSKVAWVAKVFDHIPIKILTPKQNSLNITNSSSTSKNR